MLAGPRHHSDRRSSPVRVNTELVCGYALGGGVSGAASREINTLRGPAIAAARWSLAPSTTTMLAGAIVGEQDVTARQQSGVVGV